MTVTVNHPPEAHMFGHLASSGDNVWEGCKPLGEGALLGGRQLRKAICKGNWEAGKVTEFTATSAVNSCLGEKRLFCRAAFKLFRALPRNILHGSSPTQGWAFCR